MKISRLGENAIFLRKSEGGSCDTPFLSVLIASRIAYLPVQIVVDCKGSWVQLPAEAKVMFRCYFSISSILIAGGGDWLLYCPRIRHYTHKTFSVIKKYIYISRFPQTEVKTTLKKCNKEEAVV